MANEIGSESGLLSSSYSLSSGAETLAHYEIWAETYDNEIGDDLGYAQPYRCATALAQVLDSRGEMQRGRLLDVGCGTGLSGLALRDVGFTDQDGCDFSAPMLEKATKTGVYRQLFQVDLNDGLDISDATYQAAAAVGVFSFGHLDPAALREILRVIRPGGPLVVGLNDHFWNLGTFPEELEAIESDQIATVAFREYGAHLPGADIKGWVVVLVKTAI